MQKKTYFCSTKCINMNIDSKKETLVSRDGLSHLLGIEFFSTDDPNTCQAKMKVDERNRQPYGFLSGGASLAMAETLAGLGSSALCPDNIAVGINVSGAHVRPVIEGDIVTATARIQHAGKTLHQWIVEICNSNGELVSTVQVTNFIIHNKK